MATAKKTALSFQIDCPNCCEGHNGPDGSTYWTRDEIEMARAAHKKEWCAYCGTEFWLPKP